MSEFSPQAIAVIGAAGILLAGFAGWLFRAWISERSVRRSAEERIHQERIDRLKADAEKAQERLRYANHKINETRERVAKELASKLADPPRTWEDALSSADDALREAALESAIDEEWGSETPVEALTKSGRWPTK